MRGIVKVVGTNKPLSRFQDYQGEGGITSVANKTFALFIGDDNIAFQIYKFEIHPNHIFMEGWGAIGQDSGRIGIEFIPNNEI